MRLFVRKGCALMCLVIWRGLNNGPAMHSMHFCFALGTFLAPLLASPFLNDRREDAMTRDDSQIRLYYPLVGSFGLVIAAGFLYFGLKHCKRQRTVLAEQERKKEAHQDDKGLLLPPLSKMAFLCCLYLFFLVVVGLEIAVGGYTTAFAVKSKLHLSRAEGAYSTAIYFGVFTLARFLAIFAATRFNPIACAYFVAFMMLVN